MRIRSNEALFAIAPNNELVFEQKNAKPANSFLSKIKMSLPRCHIRLEKLRQPAKLAQGMKAPFKGSFNFLRNLSRKKLDLSSTEQENSHSVSMSSPKQIQAHKPKPCSHDEVPRFITFSVPINSKLSTLSKGIEKNSVENTMEDDFSYSQIKEDYSLCELFDEKVSPNTKTLPIMASEAESTCDSLYLSTVIDSALEVDARTTQSIPKFINIALSSPISFVKNLLVPEADEAFSYSDIKDDYSQGELFNETRSLIGSETSSITASEEASTCDSVYLSTVTDSEVEVVPQARQKPPSSVPKFIEIPRLSTHSSVKQSLTRQDDDAFSYSAIQDDYSVSELFDAIDSNTPQSSIPQRSEVKHSETTNWLKRIYQRVEV